MDKFSDLELAFRMLETRNYGYTVGLFLRRHRTRYFVFFVGVGMLSCFFAAITSIHPQFGFAALAGTIGIACGALLADFQWFFVIQSTWPFAKKVTDWNEVVRIANGESPSDPK
ncbi:MAG: hypothetical protein EXS05_05955 [Planctomycetaceae bacterium]|nr:hypothetical protein [Planctomycetaceae bacterium]